MNCLSLGPNDEIFCQFMTPNFPNPMFFGQIHLGLVGALTFCFSKKSHLGPWDLDPFGAHLGLVRALLGPIRSP